MKALGSQKIWSFIDGIDQCQNMSVTTISRSGSGHYVASYLELAKKIAELQFRNRDQILMFRGQNSDHKNNMDNTSLKPGLFRREPAKPKGPSADTLKERFDLLTAAEVELASRFQAARLFGKSTLLRHRLIRWAILQHYEVCPTPLLDVTHSLRIAASFASHGGADCGYIFVIGVPSIDGAITVCADVGIQTIRLASVCPPDAVRPHIQEGYLLGEYPDLLDFGQSHFRPHEVDFGLRLVAKFRFNPKSFWTSVDFPMISHQALYPSPQNDPLFELAMEVKKSIESK